jgi:putative membrane protein
MAWGVLFRREINLTYRRIQDIHVTRNIFQRWMGLATVAIQTASGSAGPEMSIEGIVRYDELRDFLYSRMRGARGEVDVKRESGEVAPADEALQLLREIRDELAALRGAEDDSGAQTGEVS